MNLLPRMSKKRAISSVIGGMIFLILMSTGVSVYFLAIESQSKVIDTQQTLLDSGFKKIQENYVISVSADSNNNNRLVIQVKNQGPNTVEIADIWLVNTTDAINEYPAKRILVNNDGRFIPSGYGEDILKNQPLYLSSGSYNVKVISVNGIVKNSELTIGGNNNLRADMFTIPPDVRIGENVTLTMHVTNTGNSRLLNVTASTPIISPSSGIILPLPSNPLTVNLNPSESGFFTWKYKVTGTSGNKITFSSSANATEESTGFFIKSNTASDKITLRENKGSELIVLTQDLLSRPEIFMVIPSPFGDAPESSLWGLNVVNPTGQTMYVSKVTISVMSPRANNNDIMINAQPGSDHCDPVTVSPTPANWSCPTHNQLMWENIETPQAIPPYSVFPFLVKIHPGSLSGSDLLQSVIVHGHVYTTFGEFGKAGYGSSFDNRNSDTSMVNVYLSKVLDSTTNANIYVNKTAIPSGSTQTFNVVMADFEKSVVNKIGAGSRLIINIPKNWQLDTASINGFGTFATSWQIFSDTSSQIIGTLNSPLDGNGPAGLEGKTIQFRAIAPNVTNTQMYVMYVLGDGKITNGNPSQDFTIGPLSEIVLQVVPP